MKSENLFMRLCRFCSQQIASFDWYEETFIADFFFAIIVGFSFFVSLYENYKFKGPMPITNIVYGVVLFMVPVLIVVFFIFLLSIEDEKKHYLTMKLFVIVINLLTGFGFFNLGHFVLTMNSQPFTMFPINFFQDAMYMIVMMIICLVLMLIGLKYNVLLKVLSTVMNTRETKQYKGYVVTGLIVLPIIIVNRLF